MDWLIDNLALVMFVVMFFVIFCGYPVAFVLGGTALVAYARSRKSPADLAAAANAMEIYAQRIERAARAVQSLRDLR
jgi:TRAP-type mannitol/chloroaromatic compound transport system permease large subunit